MHNRGRTALGSGGAVSRLRHPDAGGPAGPPAASVHHRDCPGCQRGKPPRTQRPPPGPHPVARGSLREMHRRPVPAAASRCTQPPSRCYDRQHQSPTLPALAPAASTSHPACQPQHQLPAPAAQAVSRRHLTNPQAPHPHSAPPGSGTTGRERPAPHTAANPTAAAACGEFHRRSPAPHHRSLTDAPTPPPRLHPGRDHQHGNTATTQQAASHTRRRQPGQGPQRSPPPATPGADNPAWEFSGRRGGGRFRARCRCVRGR